MLFLGSWYPLLRYECSRAIVLPRHYLPAPSDARTPPSRVPPNRVPKNMIYIQTEGEPCMHGGLTESFPEETQVLILLNPKLRDRDAAASSEPAAGPQHSTRSGCTLWVVVKIMVPFWIP